MNPILREHLSSALQTFLTTFVVVVGSTLQAGGIQWNSAFWFAILISAARAAIKEVFARLAPVALGGRKEG